MFRCVYVVKMPRFNSSQKDMISLVAIFGNIFKATVRGSNDPTVLPLALPLSKGTPVSSTGGVTVKKTPSKCWYLIPPPREESQNLLFNA